MKALVLFLTLFTNIAIFAQDINLSNKNTFLYLEVDELPQFQSDIFNTVLEYIYSHIEYPSQIDLQGSIIVSFVVTKFGDIANIKIEKTLFKECDNEVTRVLLEMPKWTPGRKNNENVNTLLFLRIDFTIY